MPTTNTFFNKVPGCSQEFCSKGHGGLCMVNLHYSTYDLNKIKFNPMKLCSYMEMFFAGLKEIFEYDQTIQKLWLNEIEYKFRDWKERTTWSHYLSDVVDTNFGRELFNIIFVN